MSELEHRIVSGEAAVAVVGGGYVGLPLALEVAASGFRATVLDKDPARAAAIARGESHIGDISDQALAAQLRAGRLSATTSPDVLRDQDAILICVPTPLHKTKDPDVSLILEVADALAPRLRAGQLVVLESTTWPGFTREVLRPRLEQGGLVAGRDFFLAFSPERVDPGNRRWRTRNTPKVIGGVTPRCLKVARALYAQFIDTLVPVSSADAAEMVKLLENTFRAVNIGLVNEVALMCRRLGLSTWEVVDAAATKPFGFMPFYPGPGLGGHCIPVDPHYLSWKLKTLDYKARFIELAGEVNAAMPEVVARMTADALNDAGKALRGARVLVVGVSYKRDVGDLRESPALDIITLLAGGGAEVEYCDPHAPELEIAGRRLRSRPLEAAAGCDCAVIVTDHSGTDWGRLVTDAPIVIDTRNATRAVRDGARARILSL